MNVTVIGGGAWGTAMACVLAENKHTVSVWCHEPDTAREINEQHINTRYMPNQPLPETIQAHTDLKSAIAQNTWVFISTPTQFLRTIANQCKPFYNQNQVWVSLSKGIENDTILLPSDILAQELDEHIKFAVLSGPSFAHDVIQKKLTGVIVAAVDDSIAYNTTLLVKTSYFLPFICNDVPGVQLGGALKNVVALLMGVAQGIDTAANTKALLFTQAWQEMLLVARALGGRIDTLIDLSGIGDLFLTVTNQQSKNFQIGTAIGRGEKLKTIIDKAGYVPEGVNTLQSIKQIIEQYQLQLTLFATLDQIFHEEVAPQQLAQVPGLLVDGPNQ